MKMRIIYSDLSEWIGDIDNYKDSPPTKLCEHCLSNTGLEWIKDIAETPPSDMCEKCIGILNITIFYEYPCKLIINGHDYYGIKDLGDDVLIAIWSPYYEDGQAWRINKKTYEQKDWYFKRDGYPQNMIIRLGKWANDDDMDEAQKRAMEWLLDIKKETML